MFYYEVYSPDVGVSKQPNIFIKVDLPDQKVLAQIKSPSFTIRSIPSKPHDPHHP